MGLRIGHQRQENADRFPPGHRHGPDYDLFVVAQDGSFSLEVVELLREMRPQACIFWLSNLNFALRAYRYSADWFGQKSVATPALHSIFDGTEQPPVCSLCRQQRQGRMAGKFQL